MRFTFNLKWLFAFIMIAFGVAYLLTGGFEIVAAGTHVQSMLSSIHFDMNHLGLIALGPVATLRETNQKAFEKIVKGAPEHKGMLENMKRRFGIDLNDTKKFPIAEAGFNWMRAKQNIQESSRLREADTESIFTQFLRAGVNVLATNKYISQDETYSDWVRVVPSKRAFELYAPYHGVGFPRQVGPTQIYPETAAAALDLQLKNYKFGDIYSVQKELIEDDQTGQFSRGAEMLGSYLKTLTEVWVYGKLASVANMQYADLVIPTSETKPSDEANYPYTTSAAPFKGGGYNRPTSFTIVTKDALQNARNALVNQKNLLGLKMGLNPDTLILGNSQIFDARVLLTSTWYPVGSGAAGVTGNSLAENPIKNLYSIVESRFVAKNDGTFNGDSKAWYVLDKNFPAFVLQLRNGPEVVQEAPNAGESFNRDILRWRADVRLNADFIDPRGIWQGNNGSVTS